MNRRQLVASALAAGAAAPFLKASEPRGEVWLHVRATAAMPGVAHFYGSKEERTALAAAIEKARAAGWEITEQMLAVEHRPKFTARRRCSWAEAERIRDGICDATSERPSPAPEFELVQCISITLDAVWPFGEIHEALPRELTDLPAGSSTGGE